MLFESMDKAAEVQVEPKTGIFTFVLSHSQAAGMLQTLHIS